MKEFLIVGGSVFGTALLCSVIYYLIFHLRKRHNKCWLCYHKETGYCQGPNPNAPCEWKEEQPK